VGLRSFPTFNRWVRLIGHAATDIRVVLLVYMAVICVSSLLEYVKHPRILGGNSYPHYNTYLIFKFSFAHLIHGQDLYSAYPHEHFDLFKYSPVFALFMGLFMWMPDVMGLTAWSLLNSLLLFYAVIRLPIRSESTRVAILWFVLLELITSIQGCQSNGLVAALLIWSFNHLENKRLGFATLCIVLGSFVKIFSLAGFLLFLLYPGKVKGVIYALLWSAVCALFPLAVVSEEQLMFLYKSWFHLLTNDYSLSAGYSVMGLLETWFHLSVSKTLIICVGLGVLCLPLLRKEAYGHDLFRMIFLAALLMWVVIFNHKAEKQTFIIAVSGVAIWYFSQPTTPISRTLAYFAYILTTLSSTDLFPQFLKDEFVVPYVLKTVPCILIWCRAIYDLLFLSYSPRPARTLVHLTPEEVPP